jgi:hypothetical protein
VQNEIIYSVSGTQQGDPLSPVLFALLLHPLILRAAELGIYDMLAFFLDDGTTITDPRTAKRILEFFINEGPAYGVYINVSKCEVWWPTMSEETRALFPPEIIVESPVIDLLGGFLGGPDEISSAIINKKFPKLEKIIHELSCLSNPTVELALLRACIGYPTINYILRTTEPSIALNFVNEYDNLIDDTLQKIFSADIDSQLRRLCGLPMSQGGLGIPLARNLSQAAFTGSFIQSATNIQILLGPTMIPVIESFQTTLVNNSSNSFPDIEIDKLLSAKRPQKFLSMQVHAKEFKDLFESGDHRFKAHLNAVSAKDASLWLTAPSLHQVPNRRARIMLKYRIGAVMAPEEFDCLATSQNGVQCNGTMDRFGDHATICSRNYLYRRHEEVKSTLYRQASLAQLAAQSPIEVKRLLGEDNNERPADVYFPSWLNGKPNCIDVTIVSSYKNIDQASKEGNCGYNGNKAYEAKITKYKQRCEDNNLYFTPLVLETGGYFHKSADNVMKRMATELAPRYNLDEAKTEVRLKQELQVVMMVQLAESIERAVDRNSYQKVVKSG